MINITRNDKEFSFHINIKIPDSLIMDDLFGLERLDVIYYLMLNIVNNYKFQDILDNLINEEQEVMNRYRKSDSEYDKRYLEKHHKILNWLLAFKEWIEKFPYKEDYFGK